MTSPDAYGRFLRKLLGSKLELGRQLGSSAVCTDPQHVRSGRAAGKSGLRRAAVALFDRALGRRRSPIWRRCVQQRRYVRLLPVDRRDEDDLRRDRARRRARQRSRVGEMRTPDARSLGHGDSAIDLRPEWPGSACVGAPDLHRPARSGPAARPNVTSVDVQSSRCSCLRHPG